MTAFEVARGLIGIVAVIALAYGATWYVASRSQRLQPGRMIRILDRFSLSRDKAFYLLEVCGKLYLVAVTNQSVTLLDRPDPADVAAMVKSEARPGGLAAMATRGFSAVFRGAGAEEPVPPQEAPYTVYRGQGAGRTQGRDPAEGEEGPAP
ncbi:MAG: FliO/MopB family protein [Clostridiales bacterium]|nr:FliO/MopB family protein [Clostridiales bacterium]